MQPAEGRRPENLAFAFQELITVIERLRSNRQQVADAHSFRHQVREALKMASNEARQRGYTDEEIQLSVFACVAFLDESILNLRSPIFADWPRQPMQEEMFGHHVAGEIFFQHLDKLLGLSDSQALADVLEIFYLCMLLGFAGRHSIGGRGELQNVMQRTGEKIYRIRQMSAEISPYWQPASGGFVPVAGKDKWVMRLAILGCSMFVLALVLFAVYKMSLNSGITTIQSITAIIARGLEVAA